MTVEAARIMPEREEGVESPGSFLDHCVSCHHFLGPVFSDRPLEKTALW